MSKAKQASKVGPFTSARISAELAAAALNRTAKLPLYMDRTDYALYCIARAIADMARAMDEQEVKGGE